MSKKSTRSHTRKACEPGFGIGAESASIFPDGAEQITFDAEALAAVLRLMDFLAEAKADAAKAAKVS